MEAAAADRRGFEVSWQPASQKIAATTGALVGLVLSELMTSEALDSYGWRIAFLIGAVTLPFGLWMRSGLPETLHIDETGTIIAQTAGSSLGTIRTNARVIIPGLLILASGTIVTYVSQYMMTYAQNTLHVATDTAFATTVVSNGLGTVAALCGGWLADRAGRWPVMVWPQLAALLLTYPIFLWIVNTRSAFALLNGLGILHWLAPFPTAPSTWRLRRACPRTSVPAPSPRSMPSPSPASAAPRN